MSDSQDDTTVKLIRAIVDHMDQDENENWSSFAMVLGFNGEKVNNIHGCLYFLDGEHAPTTASPYDLRPFVKAYTDTYYKPGEPLPLVMLVQFDRALGQYEITFEDKDAERWNFTPENFNTFHELIRPNFNAVKEGNL